MTRTPLLALAAVAAGFLVACSPAAEPAPSPSTPSDPSALAELMLPAPQEKSPIEEACADLSDIEHMLCTVAGGPVPR